MEVGDSRNKTNRASASIHSIPKFLRRSLKSRPRGYAELKSGLPKRPNNDSRYKHRSIGPKGFHYFAPWQNAGFFSAHKHKYVFSFAAIRFFTGRAALMAPSPFATTTCWYVVQ